MHHSALLCGLGLGLLSLGGLAACNEVADGESIPAPAPIEVEAVKDLYPKSPFGVTKGSTIANLDFKGFIDAQVESSTLQPIALADFYNPHADDQGYAPASPDKDDRLYPKGSPYGEGQPKPRALLINVAAVWCGPCNEEAKNTFPDLHARYKPCGGEFFLQLTESADMGSPATQKNLASWGKKYKTDFPIALDPANKLGAVFDASAYPGNMIVDTRTMTIVEVVAGVPSEAFWKKFEATMGNPDCLAKQ